MTMIRTAVAMVGMLAVAAVAIAPYTADRETDLVSMWRQSFEAGVGVVDPHSFDDQVAYFRSQVLPHCDVRVGMHRRGIGTALLAWAQAGSSGTLHLYTFARNRVACTFYERHGFVVEHRGFDDDAGIEAVLLCEARMRETPAAVGRADEPAEAVIGAERVAAGCDEIEDARELHLPHLNSVALIAERATSSERTPAKLLVAALRMRPDRLILGEMRGEEALTFLEAINTGHPGSISTIHADSPILALERLVLMVLRTGVRQTRQDIVGYAAQTIDIIVQVGRSGGRRGVLEIYTPKMIG